MDDDISHAVEARLQRIEEKVGLPPMGEEESPDEHEEEEVDEEEDAEIETI